MTPAKIGVLILAAGASSRMGEPKQLLPWKGRPLLAHVLKECAGIEPRILGVVLGAYGERINSAIKGGVHHTYINPDWELGQGSSVSFGSHKLIEQEPGLDAILITLADQPLVDTPLLEKLIATAKENPGSAVAVSYPQGFGVPAIFPRPFFSHLQDLNPASGAKHLLRMPGTRVVGVDGQQKTKDVDTPSEYQALKKQQGL